MAAKLGRWLAWALVVCVLDQVTKHLASAMLDYGVPHPVLPGFNLTLLHNTGAAFSLLHEASGWQRWFLAGIAVLVGGVVGWVDLTADDVADRLDRRDDRGDRRR